VGPDPASHALEEIELGEPEEAGWIISVVVFGHLPMASRFQDHTGGVQKMVGSLIIPSLLLHCTSSSHIHGSILTGAAVVAWKVDSMVHHISHLPCAMG
jgi:hypothetical protein